MIEYKQLNIHYFLGDIFLLQYGIYTAMTCVFIYIIFGTAKDVNLGPAAVLSLLVSKFAKSPIEGDATYAIALAMMTGIVQFVLGAFHLGQSRSTLRILSLKKL